MREAGKRRLDRAFIVSLLLLALAGLMSWASSNFIADYFPERPLPPDFLLDALPYGTGHPFGRIAQYASDFAVTFALAAVFFHLLRKYPSRLPNGISILSVQYILRAMINVLTPLAAPHQQALFGWFPVQNGMFTSGHTASTLLAYLLVDRNASPRLKKVLFATVFFEMIMLLMSRGHYSIDIVGGALLAYFVWAEWNRGRWFNWLKRYVEA